MKTPKTKLIHPILTLLWVGVIFTFSLSSGAESSLQSGMIVSFVRSAFSALHIPTEGYDLVFWIRKLAHFTEYFILGLSMVNTVKVLNNRILLALVFLVPIIDESIQFFTPGRAMSVADMGIDALGILFGILVLSFIDSKIKAPKGL